MMTYFEIYDDLMIYKTIYKKKKVKSKEIITKEKKKKNQLQENIQAMDKLFDSQHKNKKYANERY